MKKTQQSENNIRKKHKEIHNKTKKAQRHEKTTADKTRTTQKQTNKNT